jgi:uroporphyrinogen III methyltransferase / synthase
MIRPISGGGWPSISWTTAGGSSTTGISSDLPVDDLPVGDAAVGDAAVGDAAVTVYLVGAGPGDPGLLTLRGAELLRAADVVIYDRLVAPELLELAPAAALRIDVGKRPGEAGRQAEIHRLLIEHGADPDRVVVRLKGGDPFVFGRGSEEIEVLRGAGLPYEVVPGVSSAFAVPAAAGVPVTHRGLSTSVTVVTGHVGDPSAPGGVAWPALAAAGGTLVILMGMEHRAEIARLLIDAGRPPDTPVLVVQWGTTAAERSERVTLDRLHAVALGSPATIVIGAVAGLDLGGRRLTDGGQGPGAAGDARPSPARAGSSSARAGSSSTTDEPRPLSGTSVVVTRPRPQAGDMVAALTAAGATVVTLPVIAIVDPLDSRPLAEAAAGVAQYEWVVFSSANAVERFLAVLPDARALAGVRMAAVGPATAAALAAHQRPADLVATVATAAGLLAEMPAPGSSPAASAGPADSANPDGSTGSTPSAGSDNSRPNQRSTTNRDSVAQDHRPAAATGRVLIPRAADGADVLGPGLAAAGWLVDEVEAYRTVAAGPSDGVTAATVEAASAVDVIIFSSPSTVRAFLAQPGAKVPPVVICIGPVTAEAAHAAGLTVDAVAGQPSAAGILEAVVTAVRKSGPGPR